MAVADRLPLLLAQNDVTGLDFVDVAENQVQLDLYFFNHDNAPQADLILAGLATTAIEIYAPDGADNLPQVRVDSLCWLTINGRTLLRIQCATPGDFSLYRLRINDTRVDHYFNDLGFSFKANCESDLDCQTSTADCTDPQLKDFPVNYLARDFASYRAALLAFASQAYPDWQDRLTADVGIMLSEVMAALGDELAYYQDRIAREAYLETASQRQSVKRHAQLVDYPVHEGSAASGWLVVIAEDGITGTLAAGTQVQTQADNGQTNIYEIGDGLADQLAGGSYSINAAINGLTPHCWDEDDLCLAKGATQIDVQGHHGASLSFDDPPDNPTGKWLLLASEESRQSPCPQRYLVRLIEVQELHDEILGTDISRLIWHSDGALPYEVELSQLVVHGNLLPISAGATQQTRFVVGMAAADLGLPSTAIEGLHQALEREGNNNNARYLFSLPDAEQTGLVYLTGNAEPGQGIPEMYLEEIEYSGLSWQSCGTEWQWRRSLLGVNASQANDRHYSLEPGRWQRVVGYWRDGQEQIHQDYADNQGSSIQFGNNEFGRVPTEGSVFSVHYRLGNGSQTNTAPDTINALVDPASQAGLVARLFNPFALTNGLDAESIDEVKRFAPQAFRSTTYRAVRPEDYAAAAERLNWIQRAGVSERWTGSWMSLFATPDPWGSTQVSGAQMQSLQEQLQRFRQAGREVHLATPKFADLDLHIHVCVEPSSYPGDVKARLLERLVGSTNVSLNGVSEDGKPVTAFFSADHFTFGTALERSQLEASVQNCPGVHAVLSIEFRRRGWFDWRSFNELAYPVGMDEVIRVENDPLHPSRGSLKLTLEGGA